MKKKVGNYKGKAIVEGVGEISLLKHEILFNPNQSLEPINDDDTITEIFKGNEYVWKLPSPQGEPDSDKWNKYIEALNMFNLLNVFECIYDIPNGSPMYGYRGSKAIKVIADEANKTLPNSYIHHSITHIRESKLKHPLTDGVVYDSFIDYLIKGESMSEEEALLYMTETLGLERIPLDDYKELIKELPINWV